MLALETKKLSVKYGDKLILQDIDIEINQGEIVSIIGPNGSGKSTLIKALSRCLKLSGGEIFLHEKDIFSVKSKEIAQEIAVLPQIKKSPKDLSVENLVSFGRYPHLGFGKKLSSRDKDIVAWAIEKTGLSEYSQRLLYSLSGGERQRAWIAMALAQEPNILILDEPTTYLDISFQLEILELIKDLNQSLNLTVIMVLHDLNQAARYSDKIYVLNQGEIQHCGSPETTIRNNLLRDIFKIDAHIYEDEINNCPYFIPYKIT